MNITKNKIAAAALALAIAVTPCAYAAEPVAIGDAVRAGCDVKPNMNPSDWAKDDVNKAIENGIADNAEMYWQGFITRREFCRMAYNVLNQIKEIPLMKVAENPFDDVTDEKVFALANIGIINGTDDKTFSPDTCLSREEAATFVWRMLRYAKGDDYTQLREINLFDDDENISDWSRDAIYSLVATDIMIGTGSGFAPKKLYTAEEAAATLNRFSDMLKRSDEDIKTEPTTFADKLNERMPQDKNYMFSPFSIKMALAMAANGADGATKDEILKALDIDDLDAYNKNVKQTLERYSKSDVLKLNVANSIWLNSDNTKEKFVKDFSDKMKEFFSAESDVVTRANALDKINGWVKDKTNDKISSIIDENNLDFMAMLINAVYFKGSWLKDFSEAATADDTFTDRDGNNVQIPFMNQTDYFSYARINDTEVVEMPYLAYDENSDGNKKIDMDISMYLIKSDKDINAEEILNSAEMNRNYVRLSLPKFKTEYGTSLKGMLGELGIDTAFGEMADFDKMLGEKNLQLTDVLHKTYINVDEKGTEAAAVTAAMAGATSMPPEPVSVKFDKPFTYVIMDNTTKDILFMGEYAFAK